MQFLHTKRKKPFENILEKLMNCTEINYSHKLTSFTRNNNLFNSQSNGKFSDWSKLEAFADDRLNAAKMTISPFDKVKNTVGK